MSFLINFSNRLAHLLRKDNEVYFALARQYKIEKKMEDVSAAEILLVWGTVLRSLWLIDIISLQRLENQVIWFCDLLYTIAGQNQ